MLGCTFLLRPCIITKITPDLTHNQIVKFNIFQLLISILQLQYIVTKTATNSDLPFGEKFILCNCGRGQNYQKNRHPVLSCIFIIQAIHWPQRYSGQCPFSVGTITIKWICGDEDLREKRLNSNPRNTHTVNWQGGGLDHYLRLPAVFPISRSASSLHLSSFNIKTWYRSSKIVSSSNSNDSGRTFQP